MPDETQKGKPSREQAERLAEELMNEEGEMGTSGIIQAGSSGTGGRISTESNPEAGVETGFVPDTAAGTQGRTTTIIENRDPDENLEDVLDETDRGYLT